jgi:hypothetical protein
LATMRMASHPHFEFTVSKMSDGFSYLSNNNNMAIIVL